MANSFAYVKHRPIGQQKKSGYEIVKIKSDMLSECSYGHESSPTDRDTILR